MDKILNKMGIKSTINPSLTVYEKYSNVHIINPYKPESLVMKSVSLTRASSQYLTVSPNAALELNPVSVVCWFKRSTTTNLMYISAYEPKGANNDGRGWIMQSSSAGNDSFLWGDGDGSFASVTGDATDTNWNCIVWTFNGTTGELFENNVSKGSVNDGITYTNGGGTNPNAKAFYIGTFNNFGVGNYFDGLITGFAIFNVALNSYQRDWIYNSGQLRNYAKADFYSNCVMYLPFNDSYDDYTGNGRNATAVNSPTFDSTIPQ